jgi:hypothetical protein
MGTPLISDLSEVPSSIVTFRNRWAMAHQPQDHGPETEEHTSIPHLSTMDMNKALIPEELPGQSLDHGCAARDSNPEPAD